MSFCNAQQLDFRQKQDRKRYVAKANNFLESHATRLGISPAELLAAIREHGWLAEDIEILPAAMASYLSRSRFLAGLLEAAE